MVKYQCDMCEMWEPIEDLGPIWIHIAQEHGNNELINYIKMKKNVVIEWDFVKLLNYMQEQKIGYKTVLEA